MNEDFTPEGMTDDTGDYPELNSIKMPTMQKIEAEPRHDLVAKYSLFREKVMLKAGTVYHPCGSNDVSPSFAFPESHVIYVDLDEKSMEALKKAGYDAHATSVLEYNPGNVDLLIMINPEISPKIPSTFVVPGGFVLSNDYHRTATELKKNDQFELLAMIREEKGKLIYDTENLEDYWREVETEEEFKNCAGSGWTCASYDLAFMTVKNATGKTENILEEYKRLISLANEQQNLGEGEDSSGVTTLLKINGRNVVLMNKFPSKKGNVDDLFVFRKRG